MFNMMKEIASIQAAAREASLGDREVNMILEVKGYKHDLRLVTVKALNGPLEGKEFDLRPTNTERNQWARLIDAQDTQSTSSHTEVGGILRADKVKWNEGEQRYDSNWVTRWVKNPEEMKRHEIVTDALVRVEELNAKDRVGNARRVVTALLPDTETKVTSFDDMMAAIRSHFEAGRNAYFTMIDSATGEIGDSTFRMKKVSEKQPDGSTKERMETADEAMTRLFAAHMENKEVQANITASLQKDPTVIVGCISNMVGTASNEGIEKAVKAGRDNDKNARSMTINPDFYLTNAFGVRLERAFSDRNINPDTKEPVFSKAQQLRLQDMFLAVMPESAKGDLMADGWKGVSNADMTQFLKMHGVELAPVPRAGWQRASVLVQDHKNGPGRSIVKTHEPAQSGYPYPNLETFEEVNANQRAEINRALALVLAAENVASFEKSAPAIKQDAQVEARATEMAEQKAAEAAKADAELTDDIAASLNEITEGLDDFDAIPDGMN